eukprot:3655968-Rhodomonas_salina.1
MARERQAALIKIEQPSTNRFQHQKPTANKITQQRAANSRRKQTKYTAFMPVSTQCKKRRRKKH